MQIIPTVQTVAIADLISLQHDRINLFSQINSWLKDEIFHSFLEKLIQNGRQQALELRNLLPPVLSEPAGQPLTHGKLYEYGPTLQHPSPGTCCKEIADRCASFESEMCKAYRYALAHGRPLQKDALIILQAHVRSLELSLLKVKMLQDIPLPPTKDESPLPSLHQFIHYSRN